MNYLKLVILYSSLACIFVACSENKSMSSVENHTETSSTEKSNTHSEIVGEWTSLNVLYDYHFTLSVTLEGDIVIVRCTHERQHSVQEAGIYHSDFSELSGGGGLVYIKRTDQLFYNGREYTRSH